MNRTLTRLVLLAMVVCLTAAGVNAGAAAAQTSGEPKAGPPAAKAKPKPKGKKGKPRKGNKPPKRADRRRRTVRTPKRKPPTSWWYKAYLSGQATRVTSYASGAKTAQHATFDAADGADVRVSRQAQAPWGATGSWTSLSGGVMVKESSLATDYPVALSPNSTCTPWSEVIAATEPFPAAISVRKGPHDIDDPLLIRITSRRAAGRYSRTARICTATDGTVLSLSAEQNREAPAPEPPGCVPGGSYEHDYSVQGTVLFQQQFSLGLTCRQYFKNSWSSVETNVALGIEFVPCPAPKGAHSRC